MKEVASNGANAMDMAPSAYRVFSLSLGGLDDSGQQLPEWDKLATDMQDDWLRSCLKAIPTVEEAQGLRWVDLAAELFRAFAGRQCELAGIEVPVFTGQNARARYAWEAVARHLANLIDADEGEIKSPEELERSWRDWANHKAMKEPQ